MQQRGALWQLGRTRQGPELWLATSVGSCCGCRSCRRSDKDVLKQLHKARLIEYDAAKRTVRVAATWCDRCRGSGRGGSLGRWLASDARASEMRSPASQPHARLPP